MPEVNGGVEPRSELSGIKVCGPHFLLTLTTIRSSHQAAGNHPPSRAPLRLFNEEVRVSLMFSNLGAGSSSIILSNNCRSRTHQRLRSRLSFPQFRFHVLLYHRRPRTFTTSAVRAIHGTSWTLIVFANDDSLFLSPPRLAASVRYGRIEDTMLGGIVVPLSLLLIFACDTCCSRSGRGHGRSFKYN